jgi:hypothetical protein
MTPDINLTFPHDYEVEVLAELPSGQDGAKTFYFPGGKESGGHDGVMAKIIPGGNDKPWFGLFSFGERKGKRINGIFSCPERNKLCVVAAGRGYIVSANSPGSTNEVPALPITDVRLVLENGLLLFADFTKIIALGRSGLAWKSHRLSWDGVQISGVDSNCVWGQGWDPTSSSFTEFKLDLQDGTPTSNVP